MTTDSKRRMTTKTIHILWQMFGGGTVVIVLVAMLQPCRAFNVQYEAPTLLQPPLQPDTQQFGFSLSHIRTGTDRRLLVGAPKANVSISGVDQQVGALYSCKIDDTSPRCELLDIKQDDKYKPYIYKDLKDGERLGYSIASDGKNSIVVCAPRWHIFQDGKPRMQDFPVGICFYTSDRGNTFTRFSPPLLGFINIIRPSYANLGNCQFGMSVAYVKNRDTYAMGSPGCWYWQGETWEIPLNATEDLSQQRTIGSLNMKDMGLQTSSQSSNILGNKYLGYSVASLRFKEVDAIVSSIPRTTGTTELAVSEEEKNKTLGPMVFIFKEDPANKTKLQILHKILPPTIEDSDPKSSYGNKYTYFGYSLAVVDVNGDGMEDLVVGAPFYHNSTHKDQGAIFVYIQEKFGEGSLVDYDMKIEPKSPIRIGKGNYDRFGSCVAALGDIDSDGYNDLAVGAPYMDGRGVVYIYMGSAQGLGVIASQELRAVELNINLLGGKDLKTFGTSIAKQLPADSSSGYDVAVGAHSSDAVLVFRTKEVVNFTWTLEFGSDMDLEKVNCLNKQDGTNHPCVYIDVCFFYHSRNYRGSASTENLEFTLNLMADVEEQNKRLFFEETQTHSINITKTVDQAGKLTCQRSIQVNAEREIKEAVKPYVFRGETRFNNNNNMLMLDPNDQGQHDKEKELNNVVRCEGGEAEKCKSNITLSCTYLQEFTLGESKPVKLAYTIENSGETAYNTELQVNTGNLLEIQDIEGEVTCSVKERSSKIVCPINISFLKNSKVSFNLSLTTTEHFTGKLPYSYFTIKSSVTTLSELTDPNLTMQTTEVPIKVEGTLDISTKDSVPDMVFYNTSTYYKPPSQDLNAEELGPHITHKYKIYNGNKFSIYSSKFILDWPHKINDKYFLYLVDKPTISSVAHVCQVDMDEINSFNIHDMNSNNSDNRTMNDQPQVKFEDRPVHRMAVSAQSSSSKSSDTPEVKGLEYLRFECTLNEIEPSQEVLITIHSHLVMASITELGREIVTATSKAQLEVLKMPLNATKPPPAPESSISTDISYVNGSPVGVVPIWVYIVSVLGGILILLIIVLILWKCNFFKRSQPTDENKDPKDGEIGEQDDLIEDDIEEEGYEQRVPKTPHSPMLRDTKVATGEFHFSQGESSGQ